MGEDAGRVDFVREGGRVRLDRLTDGRVMCCLCFSFTAPADLSTLPDGGLVDVCRDCAAREQEERARRG